jgi:hypothetical protein
MSGLRDGAMRSRGTARQRLVASVGYLALLFVLRIVLSWLAAWDPLTAIRGLKGRSFKSMFSTIRLPTNLLTMRSEGLRQDAAPDDQRKSIRACRSTFWEASECILPRTPYRAYWLEKRRRLRPCSASRLPVRQARRDRVNIPG